MLFHHRVAASRGAHRQFCGILAMVPTNRVFIGIAFAARRGHNSTPFGIRAFHYPTRCVSRFRRQLRLCAHSAWFRVFRARLPRLGEVVSECALEQAAVERGV
eukprot:4844909-Pleurochrysis_carterae.AAC.2